jgi:diguanylate cyclase (GGDEF)-like protein
MSHGEVSGTVVRRTRSQRGVAGSARVASFLLRGLLPVLMLVLPTAVRAICLRGPTPMLQSLGDMVGRDPQVALDEATDRLASAERSRFSRVEIAWLHAIRADAYNNLSLPNDARRAAMEGMGVMRDVREPAHVELLNEYVYNGFDTAQIDRSIPLVERARAAQRKGSAADVCLQATLGHLLRMRDRSGPAVVHMMQAYRASMRPGLEEQRIYVAALFSILMRYASDWDQALALNQEGIDWSVAKGRLHDVADFRFKSGWILVRQTKYEQALEQFRLARAMRTRFSDVVNDAYIDLMTCEALLPLGRLPAAKTACIRAARVFAAHDDASRGQARLLLARIALEQKRPRQALQELAVLVDGGDAQSASVNVAKVFLTRAQALAVLRDWPQAYDDLDRYVALSARWNQTQGARQAAILRARFETDRQADRNRELRAALIFAGERAREQRRRAMILFASGGIFIFLLGYIVLAGRRNRRRLLLIASSDALTGLLSRKWTTDLSTAILEQALRQNTPVSVALIDLDHFKNVNDTHGHAAGDEVLRRFADSLRKVTRKDDVVGRWGGEEFLLVMPGTPATQACEIVERLRASSADMQLEFSADYRVRFSAGVTCQTTERTLDELVANADLALYRAKAGGRNATCTYRSEGRATPVTSAGVNALSKPPTGSPRLAFLEH